MFRTETFKTKTTKTKTTGTELSDQELQQVCGGYTLPTTAITTSLRPPVLDANDKSPESFRITPTWQIARFG
jgi:hypothetical protein